MTTKALAKATGGEYLPPGDGRPNGEIRYGTFKSSTYTYAHVDDDGLVRWKRLRGSLGAIAAFGAMSVEEFIAWRSACQRRRKGK